MKKPFVIGLVFIVFISHSMAQTVPIFVREARENIKRFWLCRPTSPKSDCTAEERIRSKKWFLGGSLAVLAMALAATGLSIRLIRIQREKEKAQEYTPIENEKMQALFALYKKSKELGEQIAAYNVSLHHETNAMIKQTLQNQIEKFKGDQSANAKEIKKLEEELGIGELQK